VEPGDGLHEDQRWVQELVCRAPGGYACRRWGIRVTGAGLASRCTRMCSTCHARGKRRIFVNSSLMMRWSLT
jgi:hypothetical protein